jgi:hypothetical protein
MICIAHASLPYEVTSCSSPLAANFYQQRVGIALHCSRSIAHRLLLLIMAPRQRLSPPVSLDDVAASSVTPLNAEKGPLLSRRSSSSCGSTSTGGSPSASDDEADHAPTSSGVGSAPAIRCANAVKPLSIPDYHAAEAADIARERHDIFNLVALVSPLPASTSAALSP